MENESLNDTHESEDRLDTSRSSTSEEVTASPRPKVPYALHIDSDNKENEKGERKPTIPNSQSGQSKDVAKKLQTPTEPPTHTVRAPYAQPVLDASKLQSNEAKKSSLGDRIASAKERRLQQQRQLVLGYAEEDGPELDLKSRREREDQAHAKWIQSLEDKRRKIEENKMKDDAHRREVEQRKKQQLEADMKKTEAKIARTEQVYEVKMRQKRSTSSDRGTKRWSWGDNDEPKSSSQINLSSPSLSKQSSDRFSKSPLLVNTTHMTFASGLRTYESGVGRGTSPGRPSSSPGLTEPISISPRLLAPTRSSLARSRNSTNEQDDGASQSSNDSKTHGPMRSRSKDRRTKDLAFGRPNSAGSSPRTESAKPSTPTSKPAPERKSTPTRGSSPLVQNRRPPSPSSLTAPTASSEARKAATMKSNPTETNKPPKRGKSPQPRPFRAPSPSTKTKDVANSTPPRTTPKRAPSPASSRPKTKTQNDSLKTLSTPPNIKPSLRPASATQMKPRSSPVAKTTVTKTTKPATTKPKQGATKETKKVEESKEKVGKITEKHESDSGFEETSKPNPALLSTGATLSASTSGLIPKSLSDTSQGVSEIPPSETEEKDSRVKDEDEDSLTQEEVVQKPDPIPSPTEEKISIVKDEDSITNKEEDTAIQDEDSTIKQDISPEEVNNDSPQILDQDMDKHEAEAPHSGVAETTTPIAEAKESQPTRMQEEDVGGAEAEIHLAAESGFHLEEEEVVDDPGEKRDSLLDSFQTVEPADPRAVSPTDSLDEQEPPENNLQNELEDASVEYPPPDSFDSESEEEDSSVREKKEDEEVKKEKEDEEDTSVKEEKEDEEVKKEKEYEEDSSVKEDEEDASVKEEKEGSIEETTGQTQDHEPLTVKTEGAIEESVNETTQKEDEEPMEKGSEMKSQIENPAVQDEDSSAEQDDEKESPPAAVETSENTSEEAERFAEEESSPTAESAPIAEKKAQPRKTLETEEDLEAYRRTIAEKRRELKEKKEQEERERQERIRLAKIEQAKREEEARRMFEEAAAEAERERKLEEERAKVREEEEKKKLEDEKKKEEEANARKREEAEKVKKEREMQKQKLEDERMARKKRLEMIMRRTRQPDSADPSKSNIDGTQSPAGTPSPQHTPISQSPASGRSPQTESPVGGKSPLMVLTPERSISPAVSSVINKSVENSIGGQALEGTKPAFEGSEPKLLNFSNSGSKFDSTGVELINLGGGGDGSTTNIEKPVPFEAFQQKNIINGMQGNTENHGSNGSNSFDTFTHGAGDGQQSGVSSGGSADLLNRNAEVLHPEVPTEI